MLTIAGYIVVGLLGVAIQLLGVYPACLHRNILHLENGREPDAGVSLFPSIPLLPLFFVGLAWGLNQFAANLGFWLVGGVYVCRMLAMWWDARRQKPRFEALMAERANKTGADETA